MRQKRAKAYRKLMHLYCQSFGFRRPYQILVDSETCKAAISLKIDIIKQLATVLQGEVKPMITQCCIHELYLQGKPQQPATNLAKNFERRKCNHKEPITGDDCLLSVVGDKNKHRYVIATQSQPLRVKLRTVPAAPIVHINRSVVVLEPPSEVTLQSKATAEEQLLHAPVSDKDHTPPPVSKPQMKRKGPKGPNPLSVKKKATSNTPSRTGAEPAENQDTKAGIKRKRNGEDEDNEDNPVVNTPAPAHEKRRRKRKHQPSVQIVGTRDNDKPDSA